MSFFDWYTVVPFVSPTSLTSWYISTLEIWYFYTSSSHFIPIFFDVSTLVQLYCFVWFLKSSVINDSWTRLFLLLSVWISGVWSPQFFSSSLYFCMKSVLTGWTIVCDSATSDPLLSTLGDHLCNRWPKNNGIAVSFECFINWMKNKI